MCVCVCVFVRPDALIYSSGWFRDKKAPDESQILLFSPSPSFAKKRGVGGRGGRGGWGRVEGNVDEWR